MKKVFLFAAVLVAMVLCSNSEISFVQEQNEIAFKSIATRASSELGENVKMGVYAQLGGNEYFSNAVFGKNAAGVWAGEPARYWPTWVRSIS